MIINLSDKAVEKDSSSSDLVPIDLFRTLCLVLIFLAEIVNDLKNQKF